MPRQHRPANRTRAAAVALTLLAHMLLLLPFILGGRARLAEPVRELLFVSLWPLEPAAPAVEQPQQSSIPRAPTVPAPLATARPATTAPVTPVTTPETIAPVPARGAIDWHAEAARVAKDRAAQQGEAATFSPPPKTIRKPCEPRDSSFEWKAEEPRAGLLPLPFVRIGERCIIGLGFFGCALGKLPEPEGTLFDDMKEGRTPESSVPDPHVCD